MDDFDGEPSTGGGYERVVRIPLFGKDGVRRRIVMRFRGKGPNRTSVALEEQREGSFGVLVRYDDAHGLFHRHEPGWPEPGEIDARLREVPTHLRASFARSDIEAWYPVWEARVFGTGQEGECRP